MHIEEVRMCWHNVESLFLRRQKPDALEHAGMKRVHIVIGALSIKG